MWQQHRALASPHAVHLARSLLSTRQVRRLSSGSSLSRKWGVFADIHFQVNDLSRIISTADWITSVFRTAGVSQIICLGDVLNTRDSVNVQALSASVRFFDALERIAPVHVVLGNHDMNLRHSAAVSSLDYLDSARHGNSQVYRNLTATSIDGINCLMIPWVENHGKIVSQLRAIPAQQRESSIIFGHLAVSGAVQQPSLAESSRFRKHVGVLKPRELLGFRSVYLGHFHQHQRVGPGDTRIWYAGAPMQHHFGDKGDDMRGLLLVDPDRPPDTAMRFVQNPDWDVFQELSLAEVEPLFAGDEGSATKPQLDFRGKRIMIRCSSFDTPRFESLRANMVEAGASDVRRKLEIVAARPNRLGSPPSRDAASKPSSTSTPDATPTEEPTTHQPATTSTFIEALPLFLATIPSTSPLIPSSEAPAYIATAARLMRQSSTPQPTSTSTNSPLPLFPATLRTLTITNFFSIRGTLTIPFHSLAPGIWYLTGANGAGKSLILEALTWCLFGRVLRDTMSPTEVVNDAIGRDCAVRVDFENGVSIERLRNFRSRGTGAGRAAIKLYKNGKEVEDFERGEYIRTQEALERDIIGCKFEMFSKTVVLGDRGGGAGNFLGMEKDARRAVLEELLGIAEFDAYLNAVREERKRFEKENLVLKARSAWIVKEIEQIRRPIPQLEQRIEVAKLAKLKFQNALTGLMGETDKLQARRSEIEAQQGTMLQWDQTYEQLTRLHALHNRANDALAVKQAQTATALSELESLQQSLVTRNQWATKRLQWEECTKQIRPVEVNLLKARERQRELQIRINKVEKKVKKGVCPTCGQVLHDSKHAQEHLDTLVQNRDAAAHDATALSAEMDGFNEDAQRTEKEIYQLLRAPKVTETFLAHLPEQIRAVEKSLTALKRNLVGTEQQVTKLDAQMKRLLGSRTEDQVAVLAGRIGAEGESSGSSSLGQVITTHRDILRRIDQVATRTTASSSALAKATAEFTSESARLSRALEQVEVLEKESGPNSARTAELDGRLRVLLFWEMAFSKKKATPETPNMRHFLITNSILELNEHIAVNMSSFTNRPLAPAPDTAETEEPGSTSSDTNTGARTVTNQIYQNELPLEFTPDLTIHPPSLFGKRSSGQRKRNNIAVLLALFCLIRQRSRFRADFIMLDEVFDSLDVDGQVQAADLIERVMMGGSGNGATDIKYVIVVTHIERLEDMVRVGAGGRNVLRAEMTEGGTVLRDSGGVVVHVPYGGAEGVPENVVVKDIPKRVRRKKVVEVEGN